MRMSWLKSTKFWGVVVLVLALAGGTAYLVKRRSSKPKVQWETTAVDRGRITARVTATGTLSALVTVQVGSQVSGSILRLHADFNSTVKKGQVVAKIDPRLFQATLENARANYAQAKATLDKDRVLAKFADRQFKRQGPLAKDKLIAISDLDTAESNAGSASAQVEADQANVKQAMAVLHLAEVNLALTDIVSPTDGVVISRNVDVGQTVAASLQAPTLFVIAEDLRKMQVDTSVAEADVGKLRAGMSSHLHRRRVPGRKVPGQGPPDPQRRHDRAERRHLRRRHRRRQRRAQAAAGHDRERDVRLRQQGRRPAGPQRGAALPSGGRDLHGARADAARRRGLRRTDLAGAAPRPASGAHSGHAPAREGPRTARAQGEPGAGRRRGGARARARKANDKHRVGVVRAGSCPASFPFKTGITDGS
jgi:multidrug efflux pump subunit AcrA (membrane-fusion protein)